MKNIIPKLLGLVSPPPTCNMLRPLIWLILFSAALGTMRIAAQTPQVMWMKGVSGQDDDRGNKLCVDPQGNVIVTGRYRSKELRLDDVVLRNSDQDSSTADAFLVKYDPTGKLLWAQSYGGYGDEEGAHVCCDLDGNIILVGGSQCDTLVLGRARFANRSGKSRYGGADVFLAKFDPSGKEIWAVSIGGKEDDGGYATCAVNAKGDVFVTGSYHSEEFFIGSDTLYEKNGEGSTFIARFDASGNFDWALGAGSSGYNESQSCALDPEGNLFVAGIFGGEAFRVDTVALRNPGKENLDVFLLKLQPDGKLLWARSFGGAESSTLGTCSTDRSGNVFLAGMFGEPLLVIGKDSLVQQGDADCYVAKFGPAGDALWARSAGSKAMDGIRNFCSDHDGNVYLTGSFKSDSLLIGNTMLIRKGDGSENVLVLAYDGNGKPRWAFNAGGTGRNAGRSCATDREGHLYLTGSYECPALNIGGATLTNKGSSDVFIVKMNTSLAPGR